MKNLPMINKIGSLDELMSYAEFIALNSMKDMGHCRPILFFTDAAGTPGMFVFNNGEFDEKQKNEFADLARVVCVAHAAAACVFVSEIWATAAPALPGESAEEACRRIRAEKGAPSEDYERREMMMFAGETRERRVCKVLPIVRLDNREFWNFGDADIPPMDTLKGDKYVGRFAHILPQHEPPPAIREMAKLAMAMAGLKPTVMAVPTQKPMP